MEPLAHNINTVDTTLYTLYPAAMTYSEVPRVRSDTEFYMINWIRAEAGIY